jgi:hypothetical protein
MERGVFDLDLPFIVQRVDEDHVLVLAAHSGEGVKIVV